MAQLLSTQIQLDTKVSYFEDELKQISIYIDKDVEERNDLKQVTENLYERILITEEHLERDVKGSEENINKLSERLSATEVQMHENLKILGNIKTISIIFNNILIYNLLEWKQFPRKVKRNKKTVGKMDDHCVVRLKILSVKIKKE